MPSATPRRNAADLQATTVTGNLREPHARGKNLIWCASLQLAWDAAAEPFGGKLPLDGAPALGQALDDHLVTPHDLDPTSYIALGGFRRDGILEKIPAAVAEKFGPGHHPSLTLPREGHPDDLLAYALLLKNLAFAEPFVYEPRPWLRFNDQTIVESFTFDRFDARREEAQRRQVTLWRYEEDRDCIVELKTTALADRLILARVTPENTLANTVAMVMNALQAKPLPADPNDLLQVPCCALNLLRDYRELTGRKVQAKSRDPRNARQTFTIASVQQSVEFRLNANGAELTSESAVAICGAGAPPRNRYLYFNHPFLLLLVRRGCKIPYLALWIDNPELLQPVQ